MEENHHLRRPLLTAAPDHHPLRLISSNSGILLRLSLVLLVGALSIWANHQASMGHLVTVVNESPDTFWGKRFHLFYVENDGAMRSVYKASQAIQNLLYLDGSAPRKPVKRISLRLARRNLTRNVVVESSSDDEFVVSVCPSVMDGTDFVDKMAAAVRRGVARVWVWDGQGRAPKIVVDGIVEYLVNCLGGFAIAAEPRGPATVCWDHRVVAEFLDDWERRRPRFVRRLNQAMKDGWDDDELGRALGLSVEKLCTT